jgi:hypothetical protein
MGLERHKNGHTYYYLKMRVGPRVLSKYACGGPMAVWMAEVDRQRREEDEARRRAERAVIDRWRAEEREEVAYYRRVESLFTAFMNAAGYHRPNRSRWGRRRVGRTHKVVAYMHDREADVLERLQDGDLKQLPEFRRILNAHPDWADLWGDPGRLALDDALERLDKKNAAIGAATRHKLDALRKQLAGDDPTPIEQLLAERCVQTWYYLGHAEYLYATNDQQTYRQLEYMERRIDRAHRRFVQSLKALADVRRLGLPAMAVQVNIAQAAPGEPAQPIPENVPRSLAKPR